VKERATSFQSLEAFWPGRALNLATPDAPERVLARQVTPGGHRIFGEGVWLGRDFRADEGQPGKQYVVLLSHRLLARAASAPIPTSLGVTFGWIRFRIPSSVYLPPETGIVRRPMSGFQSRWRRTRSPNRHFRPLIVDGRLKPGVTIEQAQHEMDIIAADLARRFPDSKRRPTVRIVPLDTAIADSRRTFAGAELRTLLWSLLAQSASSC